MVIIIFHKLMHCVLFCLNLLQRILCCFRRKRRPSFDSVPLTHVGVVLNQTNGTENWEDWDDRAPKQPQTIQDHIDLYRQQTVCKEEEEEVQVDFFEDMTPRITRQTKVLIGNGQNLQEHSNRLDFLTGVAPTEELREWDESSGWEGETLDWDAQEALRETRRQERERRLWEQQKKRQEKMNSRLGSKINS